MTKYGYLRTIYLSFYSRDLYRDVAKNWHGGVVLYLLLLLTISWAIMMFPVQSIINQSQEKFLDTLTPQVPQITIKQGEAVTPLKRPYIIKDPSNNEPFAVIDTTGKYKNPEEANTQVLLTKTQFIYADTENSISITNIPKNITMIINPEMIKQKIMRFTGYAWVILFPLLLLGSLLYRLVQVCVYSIIGEIYTKLAKIPLSFSAVTKLTAVAITPDIVCATVFDFFDIHFPYKMLFYFVLSMCYLIFAIRANKNYV